jgi:hypothetical protein
MSFKSKNTSHYSRRLAQVVRCTLSVLAVGLLTASTLVQADDAEQSVVQVNLTEDGALAGRVVTMLDSEEAPVVARVSLTADGKTVATGTTDVVGNFSFEDVKPGEYKMVGVSGEYVGGQSIVVGEAVEGGDSDFELRVSTAATTAVAPFASAPMSSYSPAVVSGGGCYATTCGCGAGGIGASGFGAGIGGGGFGAGGGIGGGLGGGVLGGGGIVSRAAWGSSSFSRLLLLGGAVAVPAAVSDDDEVVSPDN